MPLSDYLRHSDECSEYARRCGVTEAAFDVIYFVDTSGIERTETIVELCSHTVRLSNLLPVLSLNSHKSSHTRACVVHKHAALSSQRKQIHRYRRTCWHMHAHTGAPTDDHLGRDLFVALQSRSPPIEGWHGDTHHAVTSHPVGWFESQRMCVEDAQPVRKLL